MDIQTLFRVILIRQMLLEGTSVFAEIQTNTGTKKNYTFRTKKIIFGFQKLAIMTTFAPIFTEHVLTALK